MMDELMYGTGIGETASTEESVAQVVRKEMEPEVCDKERWIGAYLGYYDEVE